MSWIEALAKTYDNCLNEVGIDNGDGIVLMPLSHITINAMAEITIDKDGNFLNAKKVEKADKITMVPTTEKSASRTGDNAPMPLCDKVSFLAGDYDEFCKPDKSKAAFYQAYMDSLHQWADLPETPVNIKAICKYLEKGTVMNDLNSMNAFDGTDGFVRFIVIGNDDEPKESRTWLDKEIYQSFEQYYHSTLDNIGCDYVSGEKVPVTQKLPAKLRHTGDKAKLISSNDDKGYTFRGRFVDASQAVGVGYISSQKAHNALRWLIAKQGYRNDSESIICWAIGGENLPDIMCDTDDLTDEFFGYDETDEEQQADTGEIYAKKLNQAIAGYQQNITPNTKAVVMAVDTADGSKQGRLSITYFNEIDGSTLLNNIQKWHTECSWRHYKKTDSKDKNEKKGYYFVGAPSPKEIIRCAYGTEQNSMLLLDSKVLKKNVDRILPCIVRGKKIPKDIVYAAVRNASNPQRFKYNHNRILTCTCAVIIKHQYDYRKEVFSMALNTESNDRDYLFGRLLAVAHKLEDYVNFKSNNGGRETNAMKYWSVYAQKPARTYQIIRERLQPYISKLNSGARNYYQELAEEIFCKLSETNSFNNEPLKENYLLGYYCQMAEFRKNKSTDTNKEDN